MTYELVNEKYGDERQAVTIDELLVLLRDVFDNPAGVATKLATEYADTMDLKGDSNETGR